MEIGRASCRERVKLIDEEYFASQRYFIHELSNRGHHRGCPATVLPHQFCFLAVGENLSANDQSCATDRGYLPPSASTEKTAERYTDNQSKKRYCVIQIQFAHMGKQIGW